MTEMTTTEQFEKQNPYAASAQLMLEEGDYELAAVYAQLALAYQQWRSSGHD
jgi:HEPN domain-containing protein